MKNVLFMLLLFCVCSCSDGGGTSPDMTLVSTFEGGKLYKAGPVRVLELHGTHHQMGRQYGALLKDDLNALYDLEVATYAAQGFTYDRLKQGADFVYHRYPQVYKDIIIGMAETSGLGMDKQIVLNALEWIPKINPAGHHCSGIGVWGDYTAVGHLVFGRNNDDSEVFKTFGGYTMVTVFNPTDSGMPVAIVNYAGVIYAPNGMNREGIFMELNSGNNEGFHTDRQPIVLTMFSFLENYSTQEQLNTTFQSVSPDLASIVNVADKNIAYSFECSTSTVVRREPDEPGLLVATNHFVDPSWGIGPPVPDKENGWTALRRDNLLKLAAANKGSFDAAKMRQVLDTTMAKGGATDPSGTIYQIVAVPKERTLWLKAPTHFDWQKIDLRFLFAKQGN
jgi:hypothetical protein